MLDFFKFYATYEVAFAIGKRLPGVVKGIWKGFCFMLSVVIWGALINKESSVMDFHISGGVTALNILYILFVIGGTIGLVVLYVLKKIELSKAYYCLLMVSSLAIGTVNAMGEGVMVMIFGAFLGYAMFHLPWFVYSLAMDVTRKINK